MGGTRCEGATQKILTTRKRKLLMVPTNERETLFQSNQQI